MKFLNPENYQPKANEVYLLLKQKIRTVLPTAQVEHIGSSAIKGAISKGDVDIFVGVSNDKFSQSLDTLQSFGFKIKKGTLRTPELCMFECFDCDIDVGIQLVDLSSAHTDFLTFRDALLNDASLLQKYNQLKLDSVDLTHEQYRIKKSEFINSALKGQVLRFDSLSIRTPQASELENVYLMGFDVWSDSDDLPTYLDGCRSSAKYKSGEWVVLFSENNLPISSLLIHRFEASIFGIGSIATNPNLRKKGAASWLIKKTIEKLEVDSAKLIYLYSDIDTKFYEKFGFTALSQDRQLYKTTTCMVRSVGDKILAAEPTPPPYF